MVRGRPGIPSALSNWSPPFVIGNGRPVVLVVCRNGLPVKGVHPAEGGLLSFAFPEGIVGVLKVAGCLPFSNMVARPVLKRD